MANIIFESTKPCYRYDSETYKYLGVEKAELDLDTSLRTGKATYIMPEFCTMVELPPFDEARELVVFNTTMQDWVVQTLRNQPKYIVLSDNDVVYSDINTRILNYEEDKFLSTDAKAVFQSMYRLFTTEEGEIPYYRIYGCRMKKFLQYPLTETTADTIFDYLQSRVEQFETRGKLLKCDAKADINNNTLYMTLWAQCKASGETGVLPDLLVSVNRK